MKMKMRSLAKKEFMLKDVAFILVTTEAPEWFK